MRRSALSLYTVQAVEDNSTNNNNYLIHLHFPSLEVFVILQLKMCAPARALLMGKCARWYLREFPHIITHSTRVQRYFHPKKF